MTPLKRRVLFIIFSFLFVILSGVLILYALGNRFNFKTFTIEKTGGIYIISHPSNAALTLNGRTVVNASNILTPGTLIDNLTSGRYEMTVSESGYSTWKKNIKVAPGLVSVYDSVVLVPQNAAEPVSLPTSTLAATSQGIGSIDLADGNLIISASDGGIYVAGQRLRGNKIVDISKSGQLITYSTLTGSYYLSDPLSSSVPTNLSSEFTLDARRLLSPRERVTGMVFSSVSDQYVLVRTDLALYGLNLGQHSAQLISGKLSAYASGGNDVYWINPNGVESYNVVFQVFGKFSNAPADQSGVKDLTTASAGGQLFVLYNDGQLYMLTKNQAPKLLAPSVNSVSLSPVGQDLIYLSGDGLVSDYTITTGKTILMKTELANISPNIVWYDDGAHLFLQSGSNLYFTEVDDRNPPLNMVKISGNAKSFAYDSNANLLYFTDGQAIKKLAIEPS
ncbi:MAG: PEGA domain-containing protein [Patescibacteria group bacterium]|nr:PEGA domain-containing protein [Patescibacteria group bacterium]